MSKITSRFHGIHSTQAATHTDASFFLESVGALPTIISATDIPRTAVCFWDKLLPAVVCARGRAPQAVPVREYMALGSDGTDSYTIVLGLVSSRDEPTCMVNHQQILVRSNSTLMGDGSTKAIRNIAVRLDEILYPSDDDYPWWPISRNVANTQNDLLDLLDNYRALQCPSLEDNLEVCQSCLS